MRYWHEIKTIQDPKFPGMDFRISTAADDMPIADCFDDSCHNIADLNDKVNRGIYEWFMVRVEAIYDGQVMGTDFLGGCMYEDAADAVEAGLDGYLEDMIDEAGKEALNSLRDLQSKLMVDFPDGIPAAA